MMLKLTSLGGAGTVTGSKHLLEHGSRRLLIDCGLFQGRRDLRVLNWQALPIPPSSVEAVVLTHAHLDHSGYLPRLVREGFRGPIYATPATIDVAKLILLDSAFLQEKDAEFANRHGFSRHEPALPLYTGADAQLAIEHLRPVPFHEPLDLGDGGSLMFRRAGHILGAATAELRLAGETIVFSGDLGRYDDETMFPPEPVPEADYLVVESTYGDRLHPKVDPQQMLQEVIDRTVRRGGTVVIPAFAVGRTQSLLYHLWMLKMRGELASVPIYVDSPMATDATELLSLHMNDHRMQAAAWRDASASAIYVQGVEQSKALSASEMPKVIISASGMATGGRVLHHIKAYAGDRRNTILFSGFQAPGTRGQALVDGATQAKIHGQWVDVRAEVADLTMLSAHADSNQIMQWLKQFRSPPRKTFIVHGEPAASKVLLDRIESELDWTCVISKMGDERQLESSGSPLRVQKAPPEARPVGTSRRLKA